MVKRLRSRMDTLLRYLSPFAGFRLKKSDLRSEERIFDIFYSFYSAFENVLIFYSLLTCWSGLVWSENISHILLIVTQQEQANGAKDEDLAAAVEEWREKCDRLHLESEKM